MGNSFVEDECFENVDFSTQKLEAQEYDHCTFLNCTFSDAVISGINFTDCIFEECDLSNCKLQNTAFKTVDFVKCKLLGLHFDDCNPFLFSVFFKQCVLDFSSFYKMKLKQTTFSDCQLIEVEFNESDLSESVFLNCDLNKASFNNTNLTSCDLRLAINFTIDPENNKLNKAKFSQDGLSGLLLKYNIKVH